MSAGSLWMVSSMDRNLIFPKDADMAGPTTQKAWDAAYPVGRFTRSSRMRLPASLVRIAGYKVRGGQSPGTPARFRVALHTRGPSWVIRVDLDRRRGGRSTPASRHVGEQWVSLLWARTRSRIIDRSLRQERGDIKLEHPCGPKLSRRRSPSLPSMWPKSLGRDCHGEGGDSRHTGSGRKVAPACRPRQSLFPSRPPVSSPARRAA
jgi:hypothetical protein